MSGSEGLQAPEINPLRSNLKSQPYDRSPAPSTPPRRRRGIPGPCMENQPSMSTEKRFARRVLVFCASSSSCDPAFHDAAAALGQAIAHAGDSLVYGGGAVGSMGAMADAALAEGGRVLGIIPRFMRELEWAHSGLTELRLVDDMQQRKREMLREADAIVTLPGGSGTFEELFEAITSKRLGFFCKPIVIVNQNKFYDPLFRLLHSSVEERFMNDAHLDMWHAVETIDDVLPAIESATVWPEDALRFATR